MGSNKEGIGAHSSRLQNWIEHEILHLQMHGGDHDDLSRYPNRNLSLRMPATAHLMLFRLAQTLGRSKTACAEEILGNAIRDAYEQFDMPEITAADLDAYATDGEKAVAEKSPAAARARRSPHVHD